MGAALALDIGGTKLAAGIVADDGTIIERAMVATPTGVDAGAATIWSVVASLVEQVRSSSATETVVVGCGCGGPMSPGGELVSPLNIHGWRDFPLRARLAGLTGLPVFVDNDAKALALGEGRFGAAHGERNFIAMVVSTGVGGGIVLDGRLLNGEGGNAGHVGHVIVEPDGRLCGCGARGCLEAEASGTAIRARTGAPPADAPPAERRRAGRLVGRAVASVANLLDLRLAVVAGSVALGFGDEFFRAAQDEVHERARLSFSCTARIVPGGLGPDGPLVGAACVGWRGLGGDLSPS